MKTCNDKTGSDKKLHALTCFLITMAAGMAAMAFSTTHLFHMRTWLAALTGFATAMLAGIVKEIHDSRQPGNHFCIWDIVADAAGALLGPACVAVTSYLIS